MPVTRLSPLDASFLAVETPTAHMHVGWVAVLEAPADRRRPELRGAPGPHRGPALPGASLPAGAAKRPLGIGGPVWVDDQELRNRSPRRPGPIEAAVGRGRVVHVEAPLTRAPAVADLHRGLARRWAYRSARQGTPLHGRRDRRGRARLADASTPSPDRARRPSRTAGCPQPAPAARRADRPRGRRHRPPAARLAAMPARAGELPRSALVGWRRRARRAGDGHAGRGAARLAAARSTRRSRRIASSASWHGPSRTCSRSSGRSA